MSSDLVLQTTPITILFMSFSVLNTYNLSTRTKHYQFLRRQDPTSSPNANFVVTKMDLERLERPSWSRRIRSNLWYALSFSWRFLFGMQLPHAGPATKETSSKVQELEVWTPSEMETELFSIYSPAHALLWLAIGSTNWLLSILIMGLVSLQVCRKIPFRVIYFLIIFIAELVVICVYPAPERQTSSCSRDNKRIQ